MMNTIGYKLKKLFTKSSQLHRLYIKLHNRMVAGNRPQPFGYDWVTLRITNPGLYVAMKSTLQAFTTLEAQEKGQNK